MPDRQRIDEGVQLAAAALRERRGGLVEPVQFAGDIGTAETVAAIALVGAGHDQLESIVRALAAVPLDDGPDTWCRLCGHERGNHAPVCALGRAREWVERHA